MKQRVYVLFFVGDSAHAVARWLRRKGFEAHVIKKAWVKVYREGVYEEALSEIRVAMRAATLRAVQLDWGIVE